MLPAFESSVQAAADAGRVSEAQAMIHQESGVSVVRRLWLSATILMNGTAEDQAEAALKLGRTLDHPWAQAEPETRALAALDLAGYALRKNQKADLARAEAVALELYLSHGADPAVSTWLARIWVIVGHRQMFDGHLTEAIASYERTLSDSHPENWCTRFTACCYLVHAYSLKGIGRSDLLDRAIREVPFEPRRAGWGKAAIALARAHLAVALGQLAQAQVRADGARKKAQETATPFTEALADLFLLRLAVRTGNGVDPALRARIDDWGDQFPFVPFLASKLIKEGRRITCAIVS